MTMPAALYVDVKRGPYAALGLDCWGVERDARRYPGPAPDFARYLVSLASLAHPRTP